jgi:hypothetical protein
MFKSLTLVLAFFNLNEKLVLLTSMFFLLFQYGGGSLSGTKGALYSKTRVGRREDQERSKSW